MKKIILGVVALAGVLVFSGCNLEEGTQGTESKKQEEIQRNLVQAVPTPQITNSTTRKAIAERARLFDSDDKLTYIYLVSYGKVMAFYTVKGQVVSLRSYLTPMENIVSSSGNNCADHGGCTTGYIMSAPDVDGTYGDNVDGIFFFTTEGAYVEWKGEYLVSDQPLKLSTPVELIREIE